ncbi:V-type ATPase subunit [bacterium]|nr:V-type ATPase subunit [bacterium]
MKTPLLFKGDTKYAYASGVIRGFENYLLNRADYQKVFDADVNQIGTVLTEIGYGGSEQNPEHALDTATEQLFTDIQTLSKDKKFTDTLPLKFDFANTRTYLKSHFLDAEIPELLRWGTIPPDILTRQIEFLLNGEKSELPQCLKDAISAAEQSFLQFHSSVAIDSTVDREYIKYFGSILPDSEFFRRWFAIYTDWVNIKSFVRIIRSKLPHKLFGEIYIDCGDIPAEKFTNSVELDIESIPSTFSNTEYGSRLPDVMRLAFSGKLAPLDIFFRLKLIESNRYTKFCSYGPELLWAYAQIKLEEIGSLRTILRAKSAKLSFDAIKEVISVVLE